MEHDDQPLLDRDRIVDLLHQVAEEAERRGVSAALFLVGGGAMALGYTTARTTRDLDGVFEPKQVVYDIAAAVAADAGLAPDWLNDAVKAFLPGEDSGATVIFERPGLRVSIASPRYLFVMKAIAGREADEEDLRALYALAGFGSASEALDTVERAYPTRPLSPAVQYLVEGIAADPGSS